MEDKQNKCDEIHETSMLSRTVLGNCIKDLCPFGQLKERNTETYHFHEIPNYNSKGNIIQKPLSDDLSLNKNQKSTSLRYKY